MALPANISTGRVTGQFIVGVADGVDADDEPDFIAARGTIAFTASTPYLPNPTASPNPVTMLNTTILGVLDDEGYLCTPSPSNPSIAGRRGIRLVATDDPDASVEGWTWKATPKLENVNGSSIADAIKTFDFALPSDSTVDLTTVVKVPASQGIGTEQAEALAASAQAAAKAAAISVDDALAAAMNAEESARAANLTLIELGNNTAEAVEREISTEGSLGNAAVGRVVGQVVPPQVQRLTAQYLAEDGTVADAAASAVDTALDSADVILGTDTRILQRTMETEYAIPFADRDGFVAGGFTADGGHLSLNKSMILPDDAVQTDSVVGMTSLDPSTGYVSGAMDKDGYLSFGIRTDGAFRVFKGDGGVASRTKIACFGDSLTRGYTGGTAWDIADSWPSRLGVMLPGAQVANLGYGGNTADEIRIRSGAKDLLLTPAGGMIPATGSVVVTTRQNVGFIGDGNITFSGFLAGIFGSFQRTAGVMTFTRRSPGVGVAVTTPTKFVVAEPDYSGHTAIIWLGRNDVSYGVTGAETTVAEHVVASTLELVEWLTPRMKQVIVVGTTNRVDEPRGTEKYDTVIEINQRLSQLLPGKYMDVRTWLVNRAIYDAGMTPTQADLDAIAKDTPPPQIMDGGSHYNKPIAPLLAGMFHKRLIEKGYI